MKIKVHESKNEASVPSADGYLVQYKFKNGFKDFRISDCAFAKDLASVSSLVRSKSDGRFTFVRFWVDSSGKAARAQLEQAVKIFQGNPDFTVERNKGTGEYWVYFTYDVKVWPLVDGQELSKAIPLYVTPKGEVLSAQEYKDLKYDWVDKLREFSDIRVA